MPSTVSSTPSGTSTPAVQQGGAATGAGSRPFAAATSTSTSDSDLWAQLQQRMGQYSIPESEIYNTSPETTTQLLQSLGFGPVDQARLKRLISNRQQSGAGAGTNASPPASRPANYGASSSVGAGAAAPGIGSAASPYTGYTAAAAASPNAGAAGARGQSPLEGPSGVKGLSFDGDQVIARCSVYPHLPAEFWCCACNVLVSSRCHVQGIHKDHPFITLRLAAESHVRDVTAWNERCRTQLNVIASVMNNLRHAESLVQDAAAKEMAALETTVQTVIDDLMRWKEQLKQDVVAQTATQQASVGHAMKHTEGLYQQYSEALSRAEPLMAHIPPVEGTDKTGEEWALRVLDLVSKLKHVNAEAIPMPKIAVPRVTTNASPSTHMELVKCVSTPLGVRLPDLLDPGYFNFPNPSVSARLPFTLVAGDDAASKGILLYNGRTLTRTQDVVPSHHLVLASQVFYSGSTSWEVHLDRLGAGTGRVLAGVTVNGSDGEGVVWDGLRIVGPNEGEMRTLDDRYQWRPGTVLRFHLELDGPGCFLNCFYDRDGIARIPLPANGHGWVPAFSVFGPQDQVTIVPATTTQPAGANAPSTKNRHATLAAGDTTGALERQEHLISSLQQQLNAVTNRVESNTFAQHDPQAEAYASPPPRPAGGPMTAFGSPAGAPAAYGQQQPQQQQQSPQTTPAPAVSAAGGAPPAAASSSGAAPGGYQLPAFAAGGGGGSAPYQPGASGAGGATGRSGSGGRRSYARDPMEAYTPELRSIIRFVEDKNQ